MSGWRKLDNINLINTQQAFDELTTDMSGKGTRHILIERKEYKMAFKLDSVVLWGRNMEE